jgi:sec-independent protein translocase protein TatC
MPRQPDEDLFKDTTMTFGEHLEELRTCLFKALVGLIIGFLIGLLVGGQVVKFIQTPLKEALTKYYQQKSVKYIEEHREELRELGNELPEDPEEIEKLIELSNLRPEKVYVSRHALRLEVSDGNPAQPKEAPTPAETAYKKVIEREAVQDTDLVPLVIWRDIDKDVRTTSLSGHEPFMTYIKASLVVGVLLASPWIFYQIWSFVAAGLYPHERRYVQIFLPFSFGLFLLGAATAFFFVFEPVLSFLFYFNNLLGIDQDIRISEWIGFVLVLPLGFGISFQLPLVMLFLERIGVFDVQAYISKWRIAVLVVFVLGMLLTPGDPYSMLLMAIPLTVLYFVGILLCKYMLRIRRPFEELEE